MFDAKMLLFHGGLCIYPDLAPQPIEDVTDEDIFHIVETPEFKPFRRRVNYLKIGDVKIEPMVQDLGFIKNKQSWGYAFRFELIEIDKNDFNRIFDGFV